MAVRRAALGKGKGEGALTHLRFPAPSLTPEICFYASSNHIDQDPIRKLDPPLPFSPRPDAIPES